MLQNSDDASVRTKQVKRFLLLITDKNVGQMICSILLFEKSREREESIQHSFSWPGSCWNLSNMLPMVSINPIISFWHRPGK